MSVSSLYVLHGIQTPTSFVTQIDNARVSPGIQTIMGVPTGHTSPLFTAVAMQKPGVSFDTSQLATLLGLTGTVAADLSAGNTDLYFKQVKYFAQRYGDGTSNHIRLRMSQGFLVPGQISAGHNSEAKCSCALVASYDGTNPPIVPAGSVALAGTESSAEHFVAGPVWLNTVALTGIQSISIDFGINLIRCGGESELYDSFIAVQDANPVVTVQAINVPWSTYGLNGTALTAASFYLRARQNGANNYSNGSTQHIKFAASSGLITIDESGGGGNSQVVTTIRCTLTSPDTSTAPILATTGIAITS